MAHCAENSGTNPFRTAARKRAIAGLGTCHVSAAGKFALEREGAVHHSEASGQSRLSDAAEHLFALSERAQAAARLADAANLDYLILVPTLRCNLSCSYCQVSRAPVDQPRFDWSEETLGHVLDRLASLSTSSIKIEFQGGEPTLRLDLVEAVIAACDRFEEKQFVICTNLSKLDERLMALLDNPDVYLSTSLDGLQRRTPRSAPVAPSGRRSFSPTPAPSSPSMEPTRSRRSRRSTRHARPIPTNSSMRTWHSVRPASSCGRSIIRDLRANATQHRTPTMTNGGAITTAS